MTLPNAKHAMIPPEKLRDYLLDPDHPEGGTKAALLLAMGYHKDNWQRLETDLREQHLSEPVGRVEKNDYGICYIIIAMLSGPDGRSIVFRSVWQIDASTDVPRFITMYPEKS